MGEGPTPGTTDQLLAQIRDELRGLRRELAARGGALPSSEGDEHEDGRVELRGL